MKGKEKIHSFEVHPIEPLRGNTDDRKKAFADGKLPADYSGVRSEPSLPQPMSQNDDTRDPGLGLGLIEESAQRRSHLK
jgi:hypothetical protein